MANPFGMWLRASTNFPLKDIRHSILSTFHMMDEVGWRSEGSFAAGGSGPYLPLQRYDPKATTKEK